MRTCLAPAVSEALQSYYRAHRSARKTGGELSWRIGLVFYHFKLGILNLVSVPCLVVSLQYYPVNDNFHNLFYFPYSLLICSSV